MANRRWTKNTKNAFEGKWKAALIDYLTAFHSTPTMTRSLDYLQDNRLYDFIVESKDRVSCFVEGNWSSYETVVNVSNGVLSNTCDCPVGRDCKHGLALSIVLVWNFRRLGCEFPAEIETNYSSCFETLDYWEIDIPQLAMLTDLNDVSPGSAEMREIPKMWWKTIIQDPDWPEQKETFRKVLKVRLPGLSFWEIDYIIASLKTTKNPIERLRIMEERIDDQRKKYRGVDSVPNPEFADFLASPGARELDERFQKDIARNSLIHWLDNTSKLSNARERIESFDVSWTTLQRSDGFFILYFQLKIEAGQRGLLARKPNSISQINRSVASGERYFGTTGNQLVDWVADTQCYPEKYIFDAPEAHDETLIPVSQTYFWLHSWNRYIHWMEGGAVRFSNATAELTWSADENGDPRWVVRVSDGENGAAREIPFAEAVVIVEEVGDKSYDESRNLYFIREQDVLTSLDVHEIPMEILSAIRKLGVVPVDMLTGTSAGSSMLKVLSRGRDAGHLKQWVREIVCKGEVEFGIDEKSELVVTARAVVDDGPPFHWKPRVGWTPLKTKNPDATNDGNATDASDTLDVDALDVDSRELLQPDGVESASENNVEVVEVEATPEPPEATIAKGPSLHTVPRHEDIGPLEEWLEELVSCTGVLDRPNSGKSFVGKFGPSVRSTFLPLWYRRPDGADYYGNARFRKFVTVRSAPQISIDTAASGLDWLKVSIQLEEEISRISLTEMSKLLASTNERFVRLPDGGTYRREDLEEYRDQMDQLNSLGLRTASGEQKIHALHLAGAPAGALSKLESGGSALAEFAKKSQGMLREFSGIPAAKTPSPTEEFLRPYQRAGVDFLVWAANNFGGALLADDMGLGKTLQMLATLASLRGTAGKKKSTAPGPSLVICPASVAHNWQREANRFVPDLKVLVLEKGATRKKQLQKVDEYDLVIMNFALLRRDIETLQATKWFAIIADEAQAIKNPKSESSRSIKDLEARYRFALTGTPIENRISDLHSIVDFALPGYLGTMDKTMSSTDPDSAARACQMLRSRLRPVLTRRLKAEVAPELPERVESRIDCTMTAAQKKLYVAEVKRVRMMLAEMKKGGMKGKHRIMMLAALMRLRQICCDPMLIDHSEAPSGKTNELIELVPPLLEAGHKVLVFSQFVKMLKHLEQQLNDAGVRTYILTGSTTNRQDLVDRFENDPEPAVFLISLKAGGTGLNLVSASHVVLFDPWWNPSVEAQAIDRTHRIGQDKTVVAYRLVTEGTIEERILELQEKKRALVRNILEEDSFNRTLTSDDFQFLLDG